MWLATCSVRVRRARQEQCMLVATSVSPSSFVRTSSMQAVVVTSTRGGDAPERLWSETRRAP